VAAVRLLGEPPIRRSQRSRARRLIAGVPMRTLVLHTKRKTELVDITARVREALRGETGRAVVVFVPHTTAGVVLQASGAGAGAVASDLEAALARIVDEAWSWKHTEEGDRNPWAHVRSALTASSVTVPLVQGHLALGDLQTIFFCEFDGPRERKILLTVM
jgi:secondary thiamine-phosphate synthase enzyme